MRRKPAALPTSASTEIHGRSASSGADYPVELIHGCAHRFLGESVFEGTELTTATRRI